MKIGIVGNGFVGSSVAFGFSPQTGCDGAELRIHDKDEYKSLNTLKEVVNESDFIFVSVPTPSNKDGSINLDIVNNIFEEMNKLNHRTDNIFLLRSTVVPGTTRKIQNNCRRLNVVFNPEFLTERSAKFDFINQARVVLGGDESHTSKVAELFSWRFGESLPIVKTNYETAELVKYVNNCFFSVKISFLNEMRVMSEKCGAKWEDVVEAFVRDGRVGYSHMNVPGPDGKYGFGGSCFPKDVQAMIDFSEDLDVNLNVLKGAWETNLEVRPEKDWEKLIGRAITDE